MSRQRGVAAARESSPVVKCQALAMNSGGTLLAGRGALVLQLHLVHGFQAAALLGTHLFCSLPTGELFSNKYNMFFLLPACITSCLFPSCLCAGIACWATLVSGGLWKGMEIILLQGGDRGSGTPFQQECQWLAVRLTACRVVGCVLSSGQSWLNVRGACHLNFSF